MTQKTFVNLGPGSTAHRELRTRFMLGLRGPHTLLSVLGASQAAYRLFHITSLSFPPATFSVGVKGPPVHCRPSVGAIRTSSVTYLNIMLNSFRASSVTPVVFLWKTNMRIRTLQDLSYLLCSESGYLAWICCSRLCCIRIPSWSNWSHCWARPTVLCSVYLLSKIRASSMAAPKSSIFLSWLRMALISWCLRCTHTHRHTLKIRPQTLTHSYYQDIPADVLRETVINRF